MAKSRTHTDFVREWELSPIGRRLLREGRQFATVRRIVVAARKVFAQRGLSGARMDQIARAAGVNKALPYYYFRNKEELHRFVLETMIAQVRVAMESPEVLTMQPTDRVCALVNTTFDFVMRNPAYPRLIQREMMSDRRRLHWMVVSYHRPLHLRVVETIREGNCLRAISSRRSGPDGFHDLRNDSALFCDRTAGKPDLEAGHLAAQERGGTPPGGAGFYKAWVVLACLHHGVAAQAASRDQSASCNTENFSMGAVSIAARSALTSPGRCA